MSSALLLLHNYYPETNAGAKRATSIAENLAQRGWQVTVITLSPHHPQNRIYDGFDVKTPHVSVENGVRIIRLRPWIVPKAHLPLRLLSEALFSIQACWRALFEEADVIFASIPYMFLGPLGLLLSKLKRRPFVLDVRDLTWLYPAAAGKRTYGLDELLARSMRFTAGSSSALTAATEGLYSYFSRRPERGLVLPNGVTEAVLEELEPLTRAPLFLGGSPVVLYAGLFGYNHGLSTVVEAARLMPDVRFVFVGDGPERDALREAAEGHEHICFFPYLPFSELLEKYREADILISHVRRSPIHRWAQPAKLWEYMATGRPVIHAGEGEAVEILERHDIGLALPPDNPGRIVDAIRSLIARSDSAAEMGARGRAFVETHRNRSRWLEELAILLEEVVGDGRGVVPKR